MAKLPVLTAEQIAAALDLATVEMDIEEWGTCLKLKAFTIDERDKVLSACTEKDTKIDPRKLIRLLVVHGVIEPKLTLELVSTKSYQVIERIAKKVMEINGMQTEKGASPATVADVTF